MKTKTGIEIPDANDRYYGADEALHTLWKVCRQICDVLDKQQDEIDLLKMWNKRSFLAKSNGEIIPLDNTDIIQPNGYLETEKE